VTPDAVMDSTSPHGVWSPFLTMTYSPDGPAITAWEDGPRKTAAT
jgi:hypothetical protein